MTFTRIVNGKVSLDKARKNHKEICIVYMLYNADYCKQKYASTDKSNAI